MGAPIFQEKRYRVFAALPDNGPVAICFDPWRPADDLNPMPFAFDFLKAQGINVIAVENRGNDWYQHDDIIDTLRRIDNLADRRRRIGYGASMGAYAVVNFAAALSLSDAILFSPQYSIDPVKAPFETRYRHHAENLRFDHDHCDAGSVGGIIFYDPFDAVDAAHLEQILRHHPLTPIKIPLAGHYAFEYFARAHALTRLIPRLIATERRNIPELIAIRRSVRRVSSHYWSNLSEALVNRGRFDAAVSAAKTAAELEPGNSLHHHRYALALALVDKMDQALPIWRRLVSDPRIADLSWWRLSQAAKRVPELQVFCEVRSFFRA